ncbi:n-carbamoyl-l-amino acid hydrolase [Lasallia pustulata]|uniref:N-carbamoyl-l-amino acid hydrolase n=1 Tax=Lasallia pustulata TaxID=136370 RepID=A0A1W5CYJ9_9LECA|nr:n-carbamoyl-l-amino acid hydrolase [Lasallia pustulata]
MSMVASGVWAGEIPIEKAHALKEVGGGGRTMREELESIGYLGEMEASYKAMPIAAHFELHIGRSRQLSLLSTVQVDPLYSKDDLAGAWLLSVAGLAYPRQPNVVVVFKPCRGQTRAAIKLSQPPSTPPPAFRSSR